MNADTKQNCDDYRSWGAVQQLGLEKGVCVPSR